MSIDFFSIYFYSKISPIDVASLILFIASANSLAKETTLILSICFSSVSGIVSVTTTSFTSHSFILSIAGPDKTPCVQATYISFAPNFLITFTVSKIEPAVSISSSNINAFLPSISPITLVAIALSSFPSLLLSIKAIGHLKCSAYL